ncbi:MAG: hypothetical protein IJQ37_02290 [Clostridia bacterium]|nr:hypothetical protein [Clostridia bacterium]
MKKTLALILISVLILSVIAISASAKNMSDSNVYSGNYVVFGDSIAAGYGLDDSSFGSDEANEYVADRDSDAYAGIVARALGFGLSNYAHSGDTTTDMLKVLSRSSVRESIKNADLITISIGGNDLIDMATTVLLQAFLHQLGMSETNDEIDAMYAKLESNLAQALNTIIDLNGGRGVIMLQTLYNPFKYNSSYTFNGVNAGELIDYYIQKINLIYQNLYNRIDGFILTPTADALNGDEDSFYSMDVKPDFHPTAHGHELIAQTILASYKSAGGQPDQTESTSETSEPTESTTEVVIPTETTISTPEPTESIVPTESEITVPTESTSSDIEPTELTSNTEPSVTEPAIPTQPTEPSLSTSETEETSIIPTELTTNSEPETTTPLSTPEGSQIPLGTEKTEGTTSTVATTAPGKAEGGCFSSIGAGAALAIVSALASLVFIKKEK